MPVGQDGFIPPFQDLATLSRHLCCGESTIENWVRAGLLPPPKRVGGKRLWVWKEIERHIAGTGDPSALSTDQLAEKIYAEASRATTR